jgi:assimilatory nitrate reductase electron transfer subunit
MRAPHVVIVGNGMAGHRLALALRRRRDDLPVTVVGAEPHPAYNRVLLSNVLAGTTSARDLELSDAGVALRLGVPAVSLDPAGRTVTLADGSELGYDRLVLATGTRPFLPPIDGLVGEGGRPGPGVTGFRTLDDCRRIADLAANGPMAVLGGGLLGVEAARGLAGLGVDVTLVHPMPHLMESQLNAAAGAVLARVLNGLGVRVRLETGATAWRPGRLALTDGSALECAGVVVTAGVRAETELARAAGLRVGRGVVVDDRLAASAPGIHAIGECAEHRGRCHGLVGPCWEQADVVADLLSGADPGARYTGSRPVVRLKAHGVDLAAMGEIPGGGLPGGGAPGAGVSGDGVSGDGDGDETQVVSVSDPARGCYGALALRGERVAGAIMLGLPEATGSVVQLYDSQAPVPMDRFGLLLGRSAAVPSRSPAQLPDEALVCRCNGVTKSRLVQEWSGGAREPSALSAATRAGTGCGGCADLVEDICAWLDGDEGSADPLRPAA